MIRVSGKRREAREEMATGGKDRETRVRKPSNAIRPSQGQILFPKIIPQSVLFCYGDMEEGKR